MSTIVTRAGKGSPLTTAELDANFTNLNADKLERTGTNTVTKIAFDVAAGLTPATGEMTWDADTGTVDVGLNGASAPVISLGENQFYRVINQTGSTLTKGTLVMSAGTVGASGKIKVAAWNGSQPSKTIMGLVLADIPTENVPTSDGLGYVLAFGKLTGIQTNGANYSETWASGDIIYAKPTGGLTKTMPAAPSTKTMVAIVVNAHASNGTLFVRPTYGSSLGEDELVELASLTNNDLLQYVSANGRFENKTPAAAGLVTLSGDQTISGDTNLSSANFGGNRVSRTTANYTALSYWNSAGQKGIAGFTDLNAFFIRSGTNAADDWSILNGTLNTGTVPWARLSNVPTTLSNTVNLTGDQTIAGVKTFSSKPQSAGLSASWGTTSTTQTGAFNATMGTSTSATWLISGTSGGSFRCGMQALDSDGTLRFYQGANYFSFNGGTLTATTFSGALSGNATTATTLQTARNINGTSFNGSADITTANWGASRTLTVGDTGKSVNGSADVSWSRAEVGVPRTTLTTDVGAENTESCVAYVQNSLMGQADGALYSHVYSSLWKHQIQGDYRTGQVSVRGKNNGTWQSWRLLLDSANYTGYAPTKTGSGASGTWGISITGEAATVTNGVYTTGSYANPAWITSLAETKITFSDVTTGNSSTSSHGFLPKLNASTTQFMRGDGTWATPVGTTYSEITTAEIDAGTATTLRTITGRRVGYILNTKVAGQITTAIAGKQDTLVSGTNIKTINGNSLLGSGNINLESGYATYAKFGGY